MEDAPPGLVARLRELLDLARAVRGADDLHGLLDVLGLAVSEALAAGTVVVHLHRREYDDLQVTHVVGRPGTRDALLGAVSTRRAWERLQEDGVRRGRTYHVPRGVRALPAGAGAEDARDAFFAALENADGELLGIVAVDERRAGGPPTPEERDVLDVIVAHAALAVEAAQAATRRQRDEAATEQLLARSSTLLDLDDPADVTQAACRAVSDALRFRQVRAWLARDGGLLEPAGAAGRAVAAPPPVLDVQRIQALVPAVAGGRDWRLLDATQVEDLLEELATPLYGLLARGPHAWQGHALVVPLRRADGGLSALLVAQDPVDRLLPGPVTLAAIRTFANQAAVTIEALRTSRALGASESRAAAVLASAMDAVVMIDVEGRILKLNAAGERLFGCAEADLLGREVGEALVPERLRAAHAAGFGRQRHDADAPVLGRPIETSLVRADGTEVPVEMSLGRAAFDDRVVFTAFVRDVSARQAADRELRAERDQAQHRALHDPLTGLANRAQLEDRVARSVARAARRGGAVALLSVDLDDFKLVNDSFGHAVGDRLLRAVGERLATATRPGDLLARHGGDEFLLLLDGLGEDPVGAASAAARRVVSLLEAPVTIAEAELWIGASVGVSVLPHDAADAADLLSHADAALYRAKADGRGRHAFYAPGTEDPRERLSLGGRLRRALARGEFELHFQPVVRLEGGDVIGVEALLRWRTEDGALVPPGAFIPFAEESGLIEPIGDWVVREAAAHASRWRAAGHDVTVGFNLSARQLTRPDLLATIAAALEAHDLPPSTLIAEITETALMREAERGRRALEGLSALGVRLALDDFGAAYSSLARLRELPVDVLKIDRAFLRDVPEDPAARQIVRAVLQLAAGLGMEAVAEGIERPEQLPFLLAEGCALGQGFHLGRPVPAEQVLLPAALGAGRRPEGSSRTPALPI